MFPCPETAQATTSRPRLATWSSRPSLPEAEVEDDDDEDEDDERRGARRRSAEPGTTQDPLKLYVRQIGDGRLLTPAEERELARLQGRGRRGGQAAPHRVQPAPRHVDHAELRELRRAAARPDPGGQPRPHPRGREVRLQARLQALDVRDLVDPPVGHARDRRPGPHDPPARPRRRAGAQGRARPARPHAEAEPRPAARGDRGRERARPEARPRAARPRRGSRQPRDARRRRRLDLRATCSRT